MTSFETDRLVVQDWHSFPPSFFQDIDLPGIVSQVMTKKVTAELPDHWRGDYPRQRAEQWIKERDHEGPTLMIVMRETQRAVGFMILHDLSEDQTGSQLRLGYMLAESCWGQGVGSEVIAGLTDWAKHNAVESIVGGVTPANLASQRVLLKNRFALADSSVDGTSELIFEWKAI